jgi:competence protein ComEA
MALLVVALGAGWWWGRRPPENLTPLLQSAADVHEIATQATITVHVAGWVLKPGLFELPENSRVADAVAAAGGLLPGASAEAVNLAAEIGDGEQIIISGPILGNTGGSAGGPTPASDGKVHLNRATAADFETLHGVGPVLAGRIVAYREENGPFESIEDLLDVPGIGEAKLSGFRDQLALP